MRFDFGKSQQDRTMSNELSCGNLAVMRSDGAPCISQQDRGTSRQRDLAAVLGFGHLTALRDHASEATGKENARKMLRCFLHILPMSHRYPSNKLANYPNRVEAPSLNSNNNIFNIFPFFPLLSAKKCWLVLLQSCGPTSRRSRNSRSHLPNQFNFHIVNLLFPKPSPMLKKLRVDT